MEDNEDKMIDFEFEESLSSIKNNNEIIEKIIEHYLSIIEEKEKN